MTITYGFYDSISEDRLYNAKQMGSVFDGLILDGIYGGYLDKFEVVEDTGMDVLVGAGRAWFDHTWTYNDAAIGKTIATADALLNRIDVVYLEVNENVGVRANSIGVLTGTPATDPVVPDLTNTSSIHQYAIAHIYVGAAVTEIVQANITDMVGTEDTPYVTILVESEDLQAQVWAIVGNIYPPVIDLLALKAHDHSTDTPQIEADGIATGAVETAKIAAGAVISDKIPDDAVIAGKIADDGVIAGNIAVGGVSNQDQLANNIVISTKIASGAVGSNELAGDAVIAGKIANGAVDAVATLANDVVDDTKVGNRVPALIRRQGGHATDWSLPGATAYTPTAVRIQCGCLNVNAAATITFPIAFSQPPVVFLTPYTTFESSDHIQSVTATQFQTIYGNATQHALLWIAIGPE